MTQILTANGSERTNLTTWKWRLVQNQLMTPWMTIQKQTCSEPTNHSTDDNQKAETANGSELTNDSRDGNSEAVTWFKTNYWHQLKNGGLFRENYIWPKQNQLTFKNQLSMVQNWLILQSRVMTQLMTPRIT